MLQNLIRIHLLINFLIILPTCITQAQFEDKDKLVAFFPFNTSLKNEITGQKAVGFGNYFFEEDRFLYNYSSLSCLKSSGMTFKDNNTIINPKGFSVSFWTQPVLDGNLASATEQQFILFGKECQYYFYITSKDNFVHYFDITKGISYNTGAIFSSFGNWEFYTFSFQDEKVKIYNNDKFLLEFGFPSSLNSANQTFFFGGLPENVCYPALSVKTTNVLDNIFINNKNLDLSEIELMFEYSEVHMYPHSYFCGSTAYGNTWLGSEFTQKVPSFSKSKDGGDRSLYYDGIDDSKQYYSSGITKSSFTYLAMVKPQAFNGTIFSVGGSGVYQSLSILQDGSVQFVSPNTTGSDTLRSTFKLSLNTWYHLEATRTDTSLRLVIDNKHTFLKSIVSKAIYGNPTRTTWGSMDDKGKYFKGDIDQNSIFIPAFTSRLTTEYLDNLAATGYSCEVPFAYEQFSLMPDPLYACSANKSFTRLNYGNGNWTEARIVAELFNTRNSNIIKPVISLDSTKRYVTFSIPTALTGEYFLSLKIYGAYDSTFLDSMRVIFYDPYLNVKNLGNSGPQNLMNIQLEFNGEEPFEYSIDDDFQTNASDSLFVLADIPPPEYNQSYKITRIVSKNCIANPVRLTGYVKSTTETISGLVRDTLDLELSSYTLKKIIQVGDTVKTYFTLRNYSQVQNATNIKVLIQSSYDMPHFEFLGFKGASGSFEIGSGLWTLDDLDALDSASIELSYKITNPGVWYVEGQIFAVDQVDVDSRPNNSFEQEDDLTRSCVSIPSPVASSTDLALQVIVEDSRIQNLTWKFENALIPNSTNNLELPITKTGNYSFQTNDLKSPQNGFCSFIFEVGPTSSCCQPLEIVLRRN